MQLSREQWEPIAPLLPRQRGNVRLHNFDVVNAILHGAASGGRCRRTMGPGTPSTRA